MNKENIVFKDRLYPAIELFDFDTADGYNIDMVCLSVRIL